jgi:hypothetical protein
MEIRPQGVVLPKRTSQNERVNSPSTPYFYLNSSIPSYVGKEPLKKTILTNHQKKVLYYINLLESEHPIPILTTDTKNTRSSASYERRTSQQYGEMDMKDLELGDALRQDYDRYMISQPNLYLHTNYAFYADPICTGKSFVILSLLSLRPCVERKQLLTIWSNGLGMNVFSKIQNFEIPLSILVVPHTSLGQWDFLFYEETNIRYYLVDSEKAIESINTNEYEVLIVSDSVFDKLCQHFQGFSVSRLIFDDLLHLEIKPNVKTFDPSIFGDLRASFTWFICSEPQLCLQKYSNSRLPFAILIKQIFSFPHPGLIFRNENICLEQSLSNILPEIEISNTNVFLEKLSENVSIEEEMEELLELIQSHPNHLQLFHHFISLFIFKLDLKFISIEEYKSKLNTSDLNGEKNYDLSEKLKSIQERYDSSIDPISYDKINIPVILPCCHQIFDIITISKCFISDLRCPFCRKESSWKDILCIDPSGNTQITNKDIWTILDKIDLNEYTIFYLPSLNRTHKTKNKIYPFIKEAVKKYKCLVLNGRTNAKSRSDHIGSKKIFDDFRKQKGILIITTPIESNLHLSFIDNVYVIYPKEYICHNENVWYTEYFKNYYSKLFPSTIDRYRFPLSDQEWGNFCIGKSNKLNINFLSFL